MQPESWKTTDEPELDSTSLDAIRNLMADQPDVEEKPAPRAQVTERAKTEIGQKHGGPVADPLPPRKADGLPELSAAPPQVPGVAQAAVPRDSRIKAALQTVKLAVKKRYGARVDRMLAKVTGYRPTVKHVLLASFALLVLLRPWLVVGLFFLLLLVTVGVFLILGYDGFWRHGMAIGRWHARRNPERSVELHKRLDDFAVRWDAVLDRFPEGTVDGLYLPDFGDLAEAEARHAEAMERRLANIEEKEA